MSFPQAQPRKYFEKTIVLNPNISPSRSYTEYIVFDRMYIDPVNTTANLSNVQISIDDGYPITASNLSNGVEIGTLQNVGGVLREVAVPKPHKLTFYWQSSEDNKQIALIFGYEASIKISPPNQSYITGGSVNATITGSTTTVPVGVQSDSLGLAKDATLRPIIKASLFNTSVSANTNILSSDITPTNSPATFRIYATFDTAGVLSVMRTRSSTTVAEQLNGGSQLTAGAPYIFDIIVESGDSINLQYSVNATLLVLKIIEIPGVIA